MKLKKLFHDRQKKLQNSLKKWKIDLLISENTLDIFYLTGMELSLGKLLVSKDAATLFVDGRYQQAAKDQAACTVKPLKEAALLQPFNKVKTVGFDEELSFKAAEEWKRLLKNKCRLKPLEAPILSLREIKDPHEIMLIKKSADLLWKGFLHAKKKLKVGIKEKEIAFEFETFCRKKGAECLSFTPIIAFGANSALPHHHSGERKLKKDDIVLMDLGVQLNGYCSDMTRTFFFGKKTKLLKELYDVVHEAKEAALALCHPETTFKALDEAARKVMRKAKLEKYFIHRLGHGIGLEVHESPNLRHEERRLEPGMVITIEPGLYLPGKGGVRLEDMVVVTKTGHQNLLI